MMLRTVLLFALLAAPVASAQDFEEEFVIEGEVQKAGGDSRDHPSGLEQESGVRVEKELPRKNHSIRREPTLLSIASPTVWRVVMASTCVSGVFFIVNSTNDRASAPIFRSGKNKSAVFLLQ